MNQYKYVALLLLSSFSVYGAEPVQELTEMKVTAKTTKKTESAKPDLVLSNEALRTKLGSTIGETLSQELGMNNQSFGAGVGTPVIRGQAGSRVRVMQNSLGTNDASSLSPDHANGVEPINVERVEVLRGASTLLYGSGAIGGIVNVIDNRIPEKLPNKIIGGAAEQRYDSATDESSSALKLEGGKNGVAYHVDGFYRDSGNTAIGGWAIDEAAARRHDPSFNTLPVGELQNSHGSIANTSARSQGGSVGLSWIGDAGLLGAAVNQLDKVYGIPPDGHGEPPVQVNLKQTKYDLKAQLNQPFAFADKLSFKFGYTDYQHTEMEGGVAGTTFLNEAFESRLELQQKAIGNVTGTSGFQSVNSQFVGLGEEGRIVPKSDIDTYSLFSVQSIKQGAMTYDIGGRAEWNRITPDDRAAKTFVPLSGSLSATWAINNAQQLSLAFTHSQRAPQLQELFSDGFHHATRSYELGNASLSKELSNNLDLAYHFKNNWLTADVSLFHNWVSDYIYAQRSHTLFNAETENFVAQCPSDGECFPLLNNRQADATFKGFEAQAVLPLTEIAAGALDLTLFSDYTRGQFSNGSDVPRMPPLRYGLQLTYEKDDWSSNLRFTRGEAQTDAGDNETPTKGYLLLNLTTQYRLTSIANTEILLFAKAKNLLNENIRNSTSYLRNFAPEAGRGAEVGIRVNY